MKTYKKTGLGILVTALAATIFGLSGCDFKLKGYTPEEIAEKHLKERIPIEPLYMYSYAKRTHGGIVSIVDSTHTKKDFDNDGINDLYMVCKDGAIISRLSKDPNNIAGSDLWYDVGKQ
ncbi:MAG: hypothetical protein WC413_00785 [Candidatus Nanoarchaeia archaeon]